MSFENRLAATALAGAVLTLAPLATASAHDELTITTWGGAYTRSQVLAYFRPYTREAGVGIDIEHYSGGLDKIRAQVESLNIEWDVVDLTLADTLRGCEEGLLEEFDHSMLPPAPDGTPAAEDFVDGALVPCGVGQILWSTLIAYDPRAFPATKPKSIGDFWDTRRFPGRRAMRRVPQKNLEWALIADGVPRTEVYEVLDSEAGVERAFASLGRLKPHIVWWESGDEPARLLDSGEVAMAIAWNGRIYDAATRKGMSLEVVWADSIWDIDLWAIVKHSEHADLAVDFIKFATGTRPLAEQARHIAYGPARKSSLAHVDPDVMPYLPSTPERLAEALRFGSEWWAEHQDALNARFEAWLDEPSAKPEQLPR